MKITDPNIQQILDTIDAHAIICDKTGVVVANTIASDWFGIDGDDLTVLKFEALIHPTSIQTVLNAYQSLKTGASSATIRVAIQHPHLGNLWIDITAKPAKFIEDGRYWMMTFIPLRNLPLATNVAPESIGQQSIVQKDVVSAEPLLATVIEENYFVDTAIDNFFTNLQTLIPYDSCSISLAEPDGLRIIAARGLHEKVNINTLKIRQAKSIQDDTQILYQNSSTVYNIPDTQLSESWVSVEGTESIRSWMGVELKYNQQVIGILNVDSYKPDFFTIEHAKFATTLVQQAILALIYTRLYKRFYDEVEEHRRLQHILVKNLISTETMFATQDLLYSSDNFATSLPTLMQILAASMDQTEIVAIIFNLTTKKLLHKLQTGQLNVDVWAIFTEIIDKPDLPYGEMPPQEIEFPSDNMMTLHDEHQVVVGAVNKCGALIAVREKSSDAFDETDQELIVTIANQMTIAFRNELLTTQVRHQTEHLQRLVERRTSQLSVERKRLQAILDSTAEGIFYMENFKLQYANPAFCQMVGYDLDALYGKPLSFLRVTPETNKTDFISLLENPLELTLGRSETRLRHRDGAEFYASVSFSLVGQPGEEPIRMVAVARDISQERKLYIQRARFIANAAHELRTPLSSLILRLHMLRRQPERMDNHLANLDKVTNYLKELVEEMLTITRFERGAVELARENYRLQSLVSQAIEEQMPFAEEQDVKLQIDLPDEPIEMRVDGKRIHQMISNLIVNGINYSAHGHTVHIGLKVETDTVGNKNAILHVRDEGEGIEPELLPDDIFEPFARPSGGRRKETGMGLALVKEIVNLHGGTILAKSDLGEGATFRVSLPLN